MNSPITISLIIPIYRVADYIGVMADSVLGQSYPHIQYVFVNDETDDDSIDILNSLIAEKYSHKRDSILIVNQPHAGLPAARCTGLGYATGDYIWHVDSDDWITENAVEMIVSEAESSGSDVIYFNFVQEYSENSKIKKERLYTIDKKNEYVWDMFNQRAYACVWNKCIKRELYERNKVYFPKYSYAEDTYLMVQLLTFCNSISYLDAPLYHYRKCNTSSLSHQKRKIRRLEYSLNFIDLYEKYKNHKSDPNPLHMIKDAIVLRAGWYSIAFDLGLFKQYPFLPKLISSARLNKKSRIGLPAQIITKIYSRIYR